MGWELGGIFYSPENELLPLMHPHHPFRSGDPSVRPNIAPSDKFVAHGATRLAAFADVLRSTGTSTESRNVLMRYNQYLYSAKGVIEAHSPVVPSLTAK